MNEIYSCAFILILWIGDGYGASVDMIPANSVLVNKGDNLDIVCSNVQPSNWFSLSIVLNCGEDKTIGQAANKPSKTCVRSVLQSSPLGETRFSCNYTVFIFSVSRVPLQVDDCRLGCKVYVNGNEMKTTYTIIKVKEPLISPIIQPSEQQIIQETYSRLFQCRSYSYPPAEIEWYINERQIITSTSQEWNVSLSSLMYIADKRDNGKHIHCKAYNTYESSNSSKVKIDITYLPDVIIYPNSSTNKVINGTKSFILHCNVIDANPPVNTYQWFKSSKTIDNKINHTIYDVSSADDGEYVCSAENDVGNKNSTAITIDVLYGVKLFKIEPLRIVEGNTISVRCNGDSNPKFKDSDVIWTKQSDSSVSIVGELVKIVNRNDSGIYLCTVIFILVPTEGQPVNVTDTTTMQLDVLYVPTIHIQPDYDPYKLYEGQQNVNVTCVLEDANPRNDIEYTWTYPKGSLHVNAIHIAVVMIDHSGRYSCRANNSVGYSTIITKQIDVQYGPKISFIPIQTILEGEDLRVTPSIDAEPSDTLIWWTDQDEILIHFGSVLEIRNITRRSSGTYICHAMNTLTPSGLSVMNSTSKILFRINVQYAPETHMEPIYSRYILYTGQQNIELACVVDDANPYIDIMYTWTTPVERVTRNNLTIKIVERNNEGVYTCIANNIAGNSNPAMIQIEVQYAPSISDISNRSIEEGENLTVVPTIEAKPDPVAVFWTRQSSDLRYNVANITFDNIQRTSSDYYTFHVENILKPSGLPEMTEIMEKTIFVDVQYPPSVAIKESNIHQVDENDTLSLHCTVEDANPRVSSIKWTKYNSGVSNNAFVIIHNISRAEGGNYTCQAVNNIGVGLESVYVDVFYAPNVTLLSIVNGSIVTENMTIVIQCSVDSNPLSTVEWHLHNHDKKEVLTGTASSFYTIPSADCFDTGTVHCTATNVMITSTKKTTKQIPLYVLCSPRLDRYKQQPNNKLGLPTGGNLNLTVYLVAYPRPSRITWKFRQNHTSSEIQIHSNDTQTDLFRHTAYLLIVNLTELEFGLYTLQVKNNIGESLTTFHVVPEGPPEPSKIGNASCVGEQATVFWETSFNGGETQQFFLIVYIDDKDYKTVQTRIVSDTKGEVKYKTITLSNGYYSFRVLGENKYGNATSLDVKSCSILGKTETEDISVVAKAAGGGVGAAVAITGSIAIVIFVFKRRTLKGKQQETGRSILTDEDKDEDNGLKDNPLYVTSHDTNDNDRDVYSQVNKSSKSSDCDHNVIDGGAVYSQVQKKTRKKKKQRDMEMGDIYENSDKIMKGHHTDKIYGNTESDAAKEKSKTGQSPQSKQNKDGLVYADLDLAPCGKRFVIRGIENRNNYAIIDLTKTAEPLSSDDDDNEEDTKNHESTTAVVE